MYTLNEILSMVFSVGFVAGYIVLWIIYACIENITSHLAIKRFDKFLTETKQQDRYEQWKAKRIEKRKAAWRIFNNG